MPPIHETDVASERWAKAEWSHYELWEKLELRLRRRKLLWVSATVLVFLALSSVPIIVDRAPKWVATSVSRKLAQLINGIKSEAGLKRQAFRLKFAGDGSLVYEIEKVASCSETQAGEVLRRGTLQPEGGEPYSLLSPEQAAQLGIPGIVNGFCYDPYVGAQALPDSSTILGFGILTASDLAARRTDRLSVLLLQGSYADLNFD